MLKKVKIEFGTDGWRAVIGDTFTFDNVRVVSQATADFLNKTNLKPKNKKFKVAIGFDTRFMSEEFAQVAACVFAANGIKVILSDRAIPTPTLSFTVKNRKLDLGIMITASHNPPEFNGFKIKSSTGGSADVDTTKAVENLLFKRHPKSISLYDGLKNNIIVKEDIVNRYIKFLRSYLVLSKLKNNKFKVLLDCMHGSGNGYMRDVISGTGVNLEIMRGEGNVHLKENGPEPVEENLTRILYRMRHEKFDLGLILDGDADRVAAVAPGGEFISPQKILGLLALHLKEDRLWSGGIVKTIAGTTMIDRIAEYLKVKLYETPVGFKYISHFMENKGILVGGEEAGGMGLKNYIPERDGTLAGLLLLEMMAYRGESIEKIIRKMENKFGRYYYLRSDLKLKSRINFKAVENNLPRRLLNKKVVQVKDYDGIKLICEDDSWLMLRPSGTEPLIRIYSEAKSSQRAARLLDAGKKLILRHCF